MSTPTISNGVAHDVPRDLRNALLAAPESLKTWENITPLARNEWICWVMFVKSAETRKNHVERAINELAKGKRRPCCWLGCTHRTDKAMSPTQQWIIAQRSKRS